MQPFLFRKGLYKMLTGRLNPREITTVYYFEKRFLGLFPVWTISNFIRSGLDGINSFLHRSNEERHRISIRSNGFRKRVCGFHYSPWMCRCQ